MPYEPNGARARVRDMPADRAGYAQPLAGAPERGAPPPPPSAYDPYGPVKPPGMGSPPHYAVRPPPLHGAHYGRGPPPPGAYMDMGMAEPMEPPLDYAPVRGGSMRESMHGPPPMDMHAPLPPPEAYPEPPGGLAQPPPGALPPPGAPMHPPSPRRHASSSRRGMPPPPPAPLPPEAAGSSTTSKRDRKRREVLDRIDRTHWEGVESREALYHEAFNALASTYNTLLSRPLLVREYALALANGTLDRNAALREEALFHAYLDERSQSTYHTESTRVEDEARAAKRNVRDRLLGVIEERKRRLREEKEGGEVSADLLEPSQRQHSTRQLRNKTGGTASITPSAAPPRMGRTASLNLNGTLDDEPSVASNLLQISSAVAALLGWSETDALATIFAAASAAERAEGAEHDLQHAETLEVWSTVLGGGTASLLGPSPPPGSLVGIACAASAAQGQRLPLADAFSTPASLLSGVNLNASAQAASSSKSKKKGSSASKHAARAPAERNAGEEDEDSGTGSPFVSTGGGRLRWDTSKCLSQLTSAKDFEVESDLINIRKIGGKRRR